jgi:hypothetical protein
MLAATAVIHSRVALTACAVLSIFASVENASPSV